MNGQWQVQQAGTLGQQIGIGHGDKLGGMLFLRQLNDQFGADSGRLAGRNGDALSDRVHNVLAR